jgi:hypothetical protein
MMAAHGLAITVSSLAILLSGTSHAATPPKPVPKAAGKGAPVADDRLWGKTRVGMSPETVRELYPTVKAQADGSLFVSQVILGGPAGVKFDFVEERLTKATLFVDAGVEEVKTEMIKSYGSPSGCGTVSRSLYICRWRVGTLQIEANTMASGGEVSTIIFYTHGTSDTASF